GIEIDRAPRPGSAAAARAFVEYAVTWAERQHYHPGRGRPQHYPAQAACLRAWCDTCTTQLSERARACAADDPDPVTRAELEALIEKGDTDELADRFDGTLELGTAGLRGELGAGSNRMNRVVVTRAAAGLAAYLKDNGAGREGSVVIGYDARHNSDVFARDTAEVMTGAGLKAYVLPRPLPTPLLAFAIRDLGCVAGVMVTASHNPHHDNR